jgi:hypothetical protein
MTNKVLSGARLRWFAAETLIVVLGILIALSLDDYRSDRQDRLMAIEFIERLQGSVNADL